MKGRHKKPSDMKGYENIEDDMTKNLLKKMANSLYEI
jgi:hypothetical protein